MMGVAVSHELTGLMLRLNVADAGPPMFNVWETSEPLIWAEKLRLVLSTESV